MFGQQSRHARDQNFCLFPPRLRLPAQPVAKAATMTINQGSGTPRPSPQPPKIPALSRSNLKKYSAALRVSVLRNRRCTNRQKRRSVVSRCRFLKSLSQCKSKTQLKSIWASLSAKWMRFVSLYLRRFFIVHLHIRQIKQFRALMGLRQLLLESLGDPQLVVEAKNFSGNMVKNLCKGILNFVVMFHEELLQAGLVPHLPASREVPARAEQKRVLDWVTGARQ